MNSTIREHFDIELNKAKKAISDKDIELAWNHLARAHIFGQFYWKPHLLIHMWMFIFAWKTSNTKEILGQIPRLLLAVPGSIFKRAPKGNTGLSNVGIFRPMAIPEDIEIIMNEKSS